MGWGWVAHRTGVLLWMDTGSSGGADQDSKEWESPFVCENGWNAWSSAWGQVMSQLRAHGRVKRQTNMGDIGVCVCYHCLIRNK